MDVINAMLERCSVRYFANVPVPKDLVTRVFEAAIHAPSSGNTQPWQIFVAGGMVMEKIRGEYVKRFQSGVSGKVEFSVTPPSTFTPAMQERMIKMRNERWKLQGYEPNNPEAMKHNQEHGSRLWGAPILAVVCMPRTLPPSAGFDIGLMTENIALAGQHYGLGSLVATGLVNQPDILRKELSIPEDLIIVVGVALGYIDPTAKIYRSEKRPVHDVVTIVGL